MRWIAYLVATLLVSFFPPNVHAQDWSASDPGVAATLKEAEQLKAAGKNADAARLVAEAIEKATAPPIANVRQAGDIAAYFIDLLVDDEHSKIAESALFASYLEGRQTTPVGPQDRQDVVDALQALYRRENRTVEAELLRESGRRDRANGQYALGHIPFYFEHGSPDRDQEFEMTFEFAQLVPSEASFALARVALRRASGSLEAAALLRRRQDLFEAWRKMDGANETARAQKRDIAALVADIDAELALLVPDQAKVAAKKQISIEEVLGGAEDQLNTADVQRYLAPSHALLLFAVVKGRTEDLYLWVVTKTERRWIKVDLGAKSLDDWVGALRCGLDHGSWTGQGRKTCASLLGLNPETPRAKELPFDFALAHDFYKALFGQVADLIAGKHLFVAPAGALARLPLHVLVTKPPRSPAGKSVSWFAREHAVTVLPSVFSLKALKDSRIAATSRYPMIAFANPSIDGKEEGLNSTELEELRLRRDVARYYQSCDVPPSPKEEELEFYQSIASLGAAETISEVRKLQPVPGTAKLVCGIAGDMSFEGSRVLLAGNATERKLRELNTAGELARYRIVHFATHGVVVGNLQGVKEAGLILTPPAEVTDTNDDGYLAASEISELNLNADWAILSACNTAAGGEKDQEALSGLARAFFYAGARAVLVSHWSVAERVAVELVTSAIHYQAPAGAGRSEALRRAMIDMVDKGDARLAHPAYWAPFVLVGEGAGPFDR